MKPVSKKAGRGKKRHASDESTPVYQYEVGARVAAAAAGGYAEANTGSVALAEILPLPRADAVMAAMLLSYILLLMAVIWAFAARSVFRAWLGICVFIASSLVVLAVARLGAGS